MVYNDRHRRFWGPFFGGLGISFPPEIIKAINLLRVYLNQNVKKQPKLLSQQYETVLFERNLKYRNFL